MGKQIGAYAELEVGGRWYAVSGVVHLGTTGPSGDDPTEVDTWEVEGCSRDQLLDAIFEASSMTRLECEEQVESVLVQEARSASRGRC